MGIKVYVLVASNIYFIFNVRHISNIINYFTYLKKIDVKWLIFLGFPDLFYKDTS